MLIISNERDLLDYYWAKDRAQLEKAIYKYTDAGLWIEFLDDGVVFGSIVEGSDAEIVADPLMYPFTTDVLSTTLDWVEGEVEMAWDDKDEDY